MDAQTRQSVMHLLLIGRSASREMQPILPALSRLFPDATISRATDVLTALRAMESCEDDPDFILVCQHRPEEYSPWDVDRLIAVAPLARIICCYGAWCESDGRNCDVWPPAVRIPVSMIARRLSHEFDCLRGDRAPLPLTASRDEVFSFNFPPECRRDFTGVGASRKSHRIRIHTPDRELERWLTDLLASAGHKPSACTSHKIDTPADVILWDLDPWNAVRLEQHLKNVGCSDGRTAATRKIIGLMGLILPEDAAVARSLGLRAILAKLAPIDDILAAVD